MSPRRERKAPEWVPAETPPAVGAPGWLDWFDLIVIHTSGGKDSQEALRRSLAVFAAAGVLDRVAALHIWLDRRHDLDTDDAARIEWHQVPALAAEQARRAGLPLADAEGWAVWDARAAGELVDRAGWAGRMHFARRTDRHGVDWDGDLLDDFATRKRKDGVTPRGFARIGMRYCTGEWKTAVGRAFTEALCADIRRERGLRRPVRVLQVLGFRAEESDERAGRDPYALNYKTSAQHSRHVWDWLPIHALTVGDVWDGIRESGVPYHPVYDEGMSRLSCRRCILGGRRDLATAARLDPAGHAEYVGVEQTIPDDFQHRRPLASITPEPGPQGFAVRWDTCPACGVPTLANAAHGRRSCPAHADAGPWAAPVPAVGGCAAEPLPFDWSALAGGTR